MNVASPGRRVGTSDSGASTGCGVEPDDLHSLVLALDYRVEDVDGTWSLICDQRSPLLDVGARHAVLYTSVNEAGRVLVTIGLRHRVSVEELLRSPALFEWFDRAGVTDLPAIFAGEVREKIDIPGPAADPATARVIVGAVSAVADTADLMAEVHAGLDRFGGAGVRKVWIYQAVDDGREVLTLLEFDSVARAQSWIDHPDSAAQWMAGAGVGGYPRPFIGTLTAATDLMTTANDGR